MKCKCGNPATMRADGKPVCTEHGLLSHWLGGEMTSIPGTHKPYVGLKRGDRVECVMTTDPWTTVQPGMRGVMVADAEPAQRKNQYGPGLLLHNGRVIDLYTILSVKWDNGSWLQFIPEAGDVLKKVDPEDGFVYDSGANAWVKEKK